MSAVAPAGALVVGVTRVGCCKNEVGVRLGINGTVAVGVGGIVVAVGMAAWVSKTIVNAAAMAVPCTSAGLIVGSDAGPHAPRMSKVVVKRIIKCFICTCLILFIFPTILSSLYLYKL
jgi:hypothetical protein